MNAGKTKSAPDGAQIQGEKMTPFFYQKRGSVARLSDVGKGSSGTKL